MSMGIGGQALASLTGNVETAILVIHDRRATRDQAAAQAIPTPPAAGKLAKLKAKVATSKAKSVAAKTALLNGSVPSVPNSTNKIFQVQINPSKLVLNASSMPKSKTDARSMASRTMAEEDADLFLTTDLYFDNMNLYDSFMFEAINASPISQATALAGAGVKAVTKAAPPSVQPQVEALLAALRDPDTRLVSFRWADFVFTGYINSVMANYTMFSTSGRPVRAVVRLRLQHKLDPTLLKHWYDSFNSTFSGSKGNLAKAAQSVGNLLNLNL